MANILLIEDDPALQEAYRFILEVDGHTVTSAYNGEEGFTSTQGASYDIILLDIHMPIMNGIEFLEKFKSVRPESTKIIVFSNMVEPEVEKQALKLGADQCILKSTATPTSILEVVKEMFEA
jgi:CheY-like chemotaxis protein